MSVPYQFANTAAGTDIPLSQLDANFSYLTTNTVTINGVAISFGGSGTITANTPNYLSAGTGLTGTSFNGSATSVFALATSGVVAGTFGSQTTVAQLAVDAYGRITSATNVPISIPSSALSTTISNGQLANSSVTIGTTGVSLGSTTSIGWPNKRYGDARSCFWLATCNKTIC